VISSLLSSALAEEASTARLEAWLAREAPDGDSAGVHELAELLQGYLNGVPSAIDALVAMTRERPLGRSVAFAAGQVLIYLVDEEDLFSEREVGALGLLDDAYLIHTCVTALRATFPELDVPPGYAPPDERALAVVRALLPAGVPEALERTCEDLVRVAATLYSGGGQRGPGLEPPRATLRVGEALASLSEASR
jgi:hypothetical protein